MMESSRRIGLELAAIGNLIKRRVPNIPNAETELTRMQIWVINYIRHRDSEKDMYQGEIERTFNITRATASNLLKRMERDGLITRESVFHDARMKKILLTDEAIRRSDEVLRCIDENERLMEQNISVDDLEVFFRVIDQIKENLS